MSNEKLDKLLVLGPASRDRRQMGPTLDLVIFDMPSVDGSSHPVEAPEAWPHEALWQICAVGW